NLQRLRFIVLSPTSCRTAEERRVGKERGRGSGRFSRRYNGQVQRRISWTPTMRPPAKPSPSVASAATVVIPPLPFQPNKRPRRPPVNIQFATTDGRQSWLRISPENLQRLRFIFLSPTSCRARGWSLSSNKQARGRGWTCRRYNGQVQRRIRCPHSWSRRRERRPAWRPLHRLSYRRAYPSHRRPARPPGNIQS